MQSLQKRRDSENVIVCPKCGAKNPSSQKRCGKCGYLFPKTVNKGKEKDDVFSNMQSSAASSFGGQGEQADTSDEGENLEPSIPKALTHRAQSESYLRSIAMKIECKKCGAQNSLQARRCMKCGNKFVEKK